MSAPTVLLTLCAAIAATTTDARGALSVVSEAKPIVLATSAPLSASASHRLHASEPQQTCLHQRRLLLGPHAHAIGLQKREGGALDCSVA